MDKSNNKRLKIPFSEKEINNIRNFLKISKMDQKDLMVVLKNPMPDMLS